MTWFVVKYFSWEFLFANAIRSNSKYITIIRKSKKLLTAIKFTLTTESSYNGQVIL